MICKKCGNERENGKRCKICARQWEKDNKHKRRNMRRKAVNKYQDSLSGALSCLISRAKVRDKMRPSPTSYEVEIDRDYLLQLWEEQSGICALSGLQMRTERNHICRVSLDRINSSEGYVVGNVQLVCKWANLAKRDASNEEIIQVVREIRSLGVVDKT